MGIIGKVHCCTPCFIPRPRTQLIPTHYLIHNASSYYEYIIKVGAVVQNSLHIGIKGVGIYICIENIFRGFGSISAMRNFIFHALNTHRLFYLSCISFGLCVFYSKVNLHNTRVYAKKGGGV